jgi:hypothetical protein
LKKWAASAHACTRTTNCHRSCEKRTPHLSRQLLGSCASCLPVTPCQSDVTDRGDEGFRAASRLLDAAKVPPPGQKILPAGNIAFGFSGTVFDWMATPEQAWRAERLGKAMQQLDKSTNIHASEGAVTPSCSNVLV